MKGHLKIEGLTMKMTGCEPLEIRNLELDLAPPRAPSPAAADDSETTLALTLWQPWASAITLGPKRIENRPWAPPKDLLGKRFWVHAGGTFDDEEPALCALDLWHDTQPETMPRWAAEYQRTGGDAFVPRSIQSGILGSARLIGVVTESAHGFGTLSKEAKAIARGSSAWFSGPFGWVLDEVREIDRVFCKGKQGLWEPAPDVLAEARAAAARAEVRRG